MNSIIRLPVTVILAGTASLASLQGADDDNWDSQFATNGLNGPVWAIAVSGSDVLLGGQFTQAGPVPVNNIARWDGTNWSALGSGIGGGLVTAIVDIEREDVNDWQSAPSVPYAGGTNDILDTGAGGAPKEFYKVTTP